MSDDEIKRLLNLANHQPEVKKEKKAIELDKEVHKFILELNIQEGETKVPNSKIYYVYTKWNPRRTRKKPSIFFKEFKKCFRRYIKNSERGYKLNQKPFILNEEDQRIYNEQQRQRDIKNQKKRNRLFQKHYKEQQEKKKLERQS
jgi:hypothetical protein